MAVLAQTKKIKDITLVNGQLPNEILISIGGNEKLFQPAAESFFKMMEAAKKSNLKYYIEDTYRLCGEPGDGEKYLKGETDFTQWAAWDLSQLKKNNPKDPRYSKYNLAADPTEGCKSKHGYGLAIDIYNNPKVITPNFYKGIYTTVDKKKIYSINPKQDELQTWIRNNGGIYGWVWTGVNFPTIEPWHFDYFYEKDQTKSSYSAPLIAKTPTQINKSTTQDQNKYAVNKNVTKNINSFFS